KRLAECAGDDVYAIRDATVFRRATPARTHEARRVRVVYHYERVIFVREIADASQVGDEAVHREHAIRRDEPRARTGRFLQALLQHAESVVRVAQALRLAEADAVDDAPVIERSGDDGVPFVQQRLEETAVRIETGGIQDGVFHPEEAAQLLFELLVYRLCAANEAHGRHAIAEPVERTLRGLADRWMISQS